MTRLYEQARVGETGCHLASVRRPGLPAHLWEGVQFYAGAVVRSRAEWRRRLEAQRNPHG